MLHSASRPEPAPPYAAPNAWVHEIAASTQPRAVLWLRSATDSLTSCDRVRRDRVAGLEAFEVAGIPSAAITVADLCGVSSSNLPTARGYLLQLAECRLVSHVWMRTPDRLGRDGRASDVFNELLQRGVCLVVGGGDAARMYGAQNAGSPLLRWGG